MEEINSSAPYYNCTRMIDDKNSSPPYIQMHFSESEYILIKEILRTSWRYEHKKLGDMIDYRSLKNKFNV